MIKRKKIFEKVLLIVSMKHGTETYLEFNQQHWSISYLGGKSRSSAAVFLTECQTD